MSCGADIVWLKTKKQKWMCVNALPTKPDFRPPRPNEVQYAHGEHEPHWATCPEADQHRRGGA
jgi:hypothetical protein